MLTVNQKDLIRKFKEEQKVRALAIRSLKDEMKAGMRGEETTNKPWKIQASLLPTAKYEFRHHHIAYCTLRGRTMDEIEKGGDHSRNEAYIDSLIKAFKEKFDAAA
jgi:hypothetical protein